MSPPVSLPYKEPQCPLQLAYTHRNRQGVPHSKGWSHCTIHLYFPTIPCNHRANEPCNETSIYRSNNRMVRWWQCTNSSKVELSLEASLFVNWASKNKALGPKMLLGLSYFSWQPNTFKMEILVWQAILDKLATACLKET